MTFVAQTALRDAVAFRVWRSGDGIGVLIMLALTSAFAWERLHSARSLARLDTITFFLPMYTFLGERLRDFDIPGWNPHQFAGAPFAGDPESGWMYLPAMLFFTTLPPVTAFKTLVTFHLALGGLSTYAFARVLGMGILPAVVAATAFEFSAFAEFTGCCTIYAQLSAWLPLALLGVEMAVRGGPHLYRAAWWCVCGLAISQMITGWFGQGAYYGLLTVGGFLAFRTIVAPPEGTDRPAARVANLLLHGAVILALGFGLAAAGVLPRLDVLSRSTLAGGDYRAFAPYVAQPDPWSLAMVINRILSIDSDALRYYAGGATLVLAIFALPLVGRRYAAPFFALTSLVALVLAAAPTPLHRAFYLLPRFQLIHEHYSFRILMILYLSAALLAGTTVTALPKLRHRRGLLITVAPVPFILLIVAQTPSEIDQAIVARSTVVAMAAVVLLLTVYAFAHAASVRRLVPGLLLIAVFADPNGWLFISERAEYRRLNTHAERLVATYTDTSGAAAFLRQRQGMAPTRFLGYEAAVATRRRDPEVFNGQFRHPNLPALLLNNRALTVGLYDVQGYNPVQVARYSTYVTAMNGERQEYHESHVLPGAFDSPLLDLLNVRYILLPAALPPGRPDLFHLSQRFPTVYVDRRVRVLENPEALPRAWIVHEAIQVPPGEALATMTNPRIDLAQVAVLEADPPPLAEPDGIAVESVTVQEYAPDAITLTAETEAPGMVVLSEVYDPGWNAYLNGEEVSLVVADHALRAVPIPAGSHALELRYEPTSLRLGLLLSGVTALIVLGISGAVVVQRLRRGRRV